ncbi:MAG: hypothetical protein GYB66_13720 [Chloroflexi bacterium]|nr:hypothetical protein [Chloroflexota bacterium]
MDKSITTALLIVISMIMALMLFNVAYPAIVEGGDAINSMANRTDERMKSQITFIHAAGELDSSGWWQDVNGNGTFEVMLWVKNIGASRIIALDNLDLFFGPEGNFVRIPHQSTAGGAYPYWTWQIESGTDWVPTATLRITIHYDVPLSQGRYFTKVTVPNGAAAEYFLGL